MKKIEDMTLSELYILLLTKEVIEKEDWPILLFYYDDDDIYRKINKYYVLEYKESKDITNGDEREELYDYARSKTRYNVFTEYIKKALRSVIYDNNDMNLFIAANAEQLFSTIYDEVRMYEEQFINIDCELSKLTKEKVIEIVREILVVVDSSCEWVNIYDSLIKDNKIIYVNELNDKERERFRYKFGLDKISLSDNACISTEEETFLSLNYHGNIQDVVNTVHEFIHYVMAIKNNDEISFIFKEFLAIFYELYAIDYLLSIGYSKDEGLMIFKHRIEDVASKSRNTLLIRKCALRQLKGFKINKESFSECLRETILGVKVIVGEGNYQEKMNVDNFKKYVDTFCDLMLEDLIVDPNVLDYNGRYVIGTYLALWARESVKYDENILNVIKYYVENIRNINPYNVFLEMGVPVIDMKFINMGKDYKRKVKK